jgi:hypothetical protein
MIMIPSINDNAVLEIPARNDQSVRYREIWAKQILLLFIL